ncbi:MAG: hypothetical protein ACRC8A_01160 [Microcoleaceae cyanobacterium]
MNMRLVVFSGVVMAMLGSISGLAVSKIHQERYQCCSDITRKVDLGYSQSTTPRQYAVVGAVMGLGAGLVLESIRQAQPEEIEK